MKYRYILASIIFLVISSDTYAGSIDINNDGKLSENELVNYIDQVVIHSSTLQPTEGHTGRPPSQTWVDFLDEESYD